MASQSHGSSLWRENAGSGAVPSVVVAPLVNVPPSFLLDWSPGAALPAGLTFTGDANRTRLDSAGVLHPVAANVPRDNGYFYSSAGVLTAAWLLEDTRKNAILNCRDLTQSSWTKGNATAHANAITGIDNTLSASTVIPSAANVVHYLVTNVVASTNGLGQAVRIFIKQIGTIYGWARIAAFTNNEATAYTVWVNLATGAIGTKDSHLTVAVTAVVNGFWRIDVSWLTVGTHANDELFCYFATANGDAADNAVGDGVSGFGIDFVQWQADGGSVSSSSILTTSTAVTRAAESATLASVGGAGVSYTFYEQYLDASGVLHDDVSAYTPGPLALTLGRAYTALRIATGTQTLAAMQKSVALATNPNAYTFAPTGTPVGSLVSDGHGGYVVTPANFTGTGAAVVVGGANTRIY